MAASLSSGLVILLFAVLGALTVIGGPHARSFPNDCLRFFHLAVHDCDKELIDGVLRGSYDRDQVLTSGRALTEIPTVEERHA